MVGRRNFMHITERQVDQEQRRAGAGAANLMTITSCTEVLNTFGRQARIA
jgi:hypothetical protein